MLQVDTSPQTGVGSNEPIVTFPQIVASKAVRRACVSRRCVLCHGHYETCDLSVAAVCDDCRSAAS